MVLPHIEPYGSHKTAGLPDYSSDGGAFYTEGGKTQEPEYHNWVKNDIDYGTDGMCDHNIKSLSGRL